MVGESRGSLEVLDLCAGGCVPHGVAVTAGVLHQHVCEHRTVSTWTRALDFTCTRNISEAINGAFQLNTFTKNVIIQPKVFLQYDSVSLPQNWLCKWHWDEPVDGDPPFSAQAAP